MGAAEVGQVLPPVFAYWRELDSRHVAALCTRPDVEERRAELPAPSSEDVKELAAAAPMMPEAEYLKAEVLRALWDEIGEAFSTEHAESGATLQEFLKRLSPARPSTSPSARRPCRAMTRCSGSPTSPWPGCTWTGRRGSI